MAESTTCIVRRNLAQLLDGKSILLKRFPEEIKTLIDELQQLEGLLKYVQGREAHSDTVHTWLSKVITGSYDAQDLVEKLAIKVEDRPQVNASWIPGYSNVSSFFSAKGCRQVEVEVYNWHKVRKDIEKVQEKIHEIVVSFNTDGVGHDHKSQTLTYDNDQRQYLRACYSSRMQDPIGLEGPTQKLVTLLTDNFPDFLYVVSITGMVGIGKTTLAQSIFNDRKVVRHFSFRAWVSLTQKFTCEKVLQEILTQLMPQARDDFEKLPEAHLRALLYEHLQRKRYLVVMDDVWSTHAFKNLVEAFPEMRNGSRFILTTRNKQVAMHTGDIVHQMEFLAKEESWKLFQEMASNMHGDEVDPELMVIGKHIYDKCHDLPLLIVGVGSFMTLRSLPREWQRVLNSMTPLGPRGNLDNFYIILESIYRDLSSEVKSFFLRLGFFPRGHTIRTEKLMHMWVADGVLSAYQPGGILRMEKKAEACLDELIDNNLIQIIDTSVDRRAKTCRVHPCIHELSILKAKEEILLEIPSASTNDHPSTRAHHKIILSKPESHLRPQTPNPCMRSIIFFLPPEENTFMEKLNLICQQFQLLRVLDMEGVVIGHNLPEGIGNLQNLRYLNLRNSRLKSLQKSMCLLQKLLTLDMRGNGIINGLSVVGEMKNLRHLYLDCRMESGHLKFDSLVQLRSIGWISYHDVLKNDSEKLKLIPLHKLKLNISESNSEDMNRTWSKKGMWKYLESLHLLGSQHVSLTHNLPLNIKQLFLHKVNISPETIAMLAKLSNLTILRLKDLSVESRCLTFDEKKFKLLEYLELLMLVDLEELNGTRLPRLRALRIWRCDLLAIRPEEIAGEIEIY